MANIVFNGFTKDEIVTLYKFICVYNSEICNSFQKLSIIYPKSSNWDVIISPETLVHPKTKQEVLNLKITPEDKHFYFSKHKGSVLKSLLHHLAQAITLGNIRKEGKNIVIDRTKESTVFGQLKADSLFSFIKLFIDK